MAVCSSAAMVRVRPSRTGRSSLTTVALTSSRTGAVKLKVGSQKWKVISKQRVALRNLLSTFHFHTSYLSRKYLPAGLPRLRQQQQAEHECQRNHGDRDAQAAVAGDPGP